MSDRLGKFHVGIHQIDGLISRFILSSCKMIFYKEIQQILSFCCLLQKKKDFNRHFCSNRHWFVKQAKNIKLKLKFWVCLFHWVKWKLRLLKTRPSGVYFGMNVLKLLCSLTTESTLFDGSTAEKTRRNICEQVEWQIHHNHDVMSTWWAPPPAN